MGLSDEQNIELGRVWKKHYPLCRDIDSSANLCSLICRIVRSAAVLADTKRDLEIEIRDQLTKVGIEEAEFMDFEMWKKNRT